MPNLSCYDCIHCDVCNGIGCCSYQCSDVSKCKFFKNKADFVEVVRCEKCKNLTVHNSPTLYAYCEKTHFRFEPFQTDTRTHYCSYGIRKEG